MIEDGLVDIFFTEDGDFYLNRKDKKLFTASKYRNEIIDSILKKRIQSSSTDWRCNSVIAANLDTFKGMARIESTIENIRSFIRNSIIADFLINGENLIVKALGLNKNIVSFSVIIHGRDPSVDDTVRFNLLYDFRENRFTPLDVLGVYR
jgi:hypothetical protein